MCKKTKTMLIIATVLVLVGGVVFGSVMTVFKWDFKKLSTIEHETNSYVIDEAYWNISISTDTADVVFAPSDDGKSSVVCYEAKNAKHTVAVKNGTLVIELLDARKWYQHIGISFASPKITVFVPQGEYGALSVHSSTGNVEIPKDYKFENIDITESTGNVTNYASASGMIKISTETGDINTENISASALILLVSTGKVTVSNVTCEGDISINVTSGKTDLTDVSCENLASDGSTGSIFLKNVVATEKFNLKRDTGNVSFEGCDAGEILVEVSTGDITGTLLTDKVFIVNSDTGKIEVPETVSGGKCKVTTDTGDIKIRIA